MTLSLFVVLLTGLGYAASQLPAWGAGGLLHPMRRQVSAPVPESCVNAVFAGESITLAGWRCRAREMRRATLIYLHGIADNRTGATGIVARYGRRGFDVVAYDSRAHGESGGDACTYGFVEKQDLKRVIDRLDPGPVVLIGASLGAAVALQAAAEDPRITAVVAAETFSDLRTVARERAPFFFSGGVIAHAFSLAERRGHFVADEVSPANAARQIKAPVFLIHGAEDRDTPPEHTRRVYAALQGRKRLTIVAAAGHNQSLRDASIWNEIDRWVDEALMAGASGRSGDRDPVPR